MATHILTGSDDWRRPTRLSDGAGRSSPAAWKYRGQIESEVFFDSKHRRGINFMFLLKMKKKQKNILMGASQLVALIWCLQLLVDS